VQIKAPTANLSGSSQTSAEAHRKSQRDLENYP